MAKFYDAIDEQHRQFMQAQPVFFTASAANNGHINVSPKGYDSFRILDSNRVAYLDLTGSGNETSAHIEENGRLTIMFCSFSQTPMILRLFGKAKVVVKSHADWDGYHRHFPDLAGGRQIIVLNVEKVQTSCGFGVPIMRFESHRPLLLDWAEKKQQQQTLKQYHKEKNARSMDGLATSLLLSGELDD